MKKCPKCWANNRPDAKVCVNCGAQLGGVSASSQTPTAPGATAQSSAPPSAQVVAGPAQIGFGQPLGGPLAEPEESDEPISVVGQPLGGYPNQQNSNVQPISPYGPPRLRYREQVRLTEKPGFDLSNFLSYLYPILLLCALIGGGIFLYWRFVVLPQGPVAAVRSFVTAATSSDLQGVKKAVSQNTVAFIERVEAEAAKWRTTANLNFNVFQNQYQGFEEGKQYELKFVSANGTTAKVKVAPGPAPIDGFKDEDLPPGFKDGLPFVVVKEGNEWKVDLLQTASSLSDPAMARFRSWMGGM